MPSKVTDDRTIHRAIRLPGKRVMKTQVDKGERKIATKQGKYEVYQHGTLITDPNQLQALAAEGAVNLPELQQSGIISGSW